MLSLSFNKDNLKFTMFMERKRGNFDGVRIRNYVHKEGFPFAAFHFTILFLLSRDTAQEIFICFYLKNVDIFKRWFLQKKKKIK